MRSTLSDFVLTVVLSAFVGQIAAVKRASCAESPRWKCGVIIPLTGPVSEWGTVVERSIEFAREDLNATGVMFLYEDDQFTPKNTVSIAQKLLSLDKVNCLVTFGSSTSMSVQDLAERYKIPLFAISLSPKVGQGLSSVFRYYVPISRQVETISQELVRRKYQRVAFVTATHDATLALRNALLEEPVISPVASEELSVGETNLASVAARLIQARPDAVFLNLVPPQPSTLARRLREMGYRGDFFGGPLLETREEITAANGTLEGAWLVTANNINAKEFNEKYRKRYGSVPANFSVYAYDIATIIIRGQSRGDLIKYVHSLKDFDGLAGRYGWNGDLFDIPAAVWVIRGSNFERVSG